VLVRHESRQTLSPIESRNARASCAEATRCIGRQHSLDSPLPAYLHEAFPHEFRDQAVAGSDGSFIAPGAVARFSPSRDIVSKPEKLGGDFGLMTMCFRDGA
jgi:hypothetical protein